MPDEKVLHVEALDPRKPVTVDTVGKSQPHINAERRSDLIGEECPKVAALGVAEHDLLNGGAGVFGFIANHVEIYRHLTPAINIKAFAQKLGFDDSARSFLRAEIRARHENHPDRNFGIGRFVARALDLGLKEALRNIEANPCPVAGLAIGVNCAAMPNIF